MRTVKIDGVVLTEEQVRKAQEELDKPQYRPSDLHLKRVRGMQLEGVVIFGTVQEKYAHRAAITVGGLTVVDTYGEGHTHPDVEHLLRTWTLIDE